MPGVIGKIGTVLGSHKVNIGNFALGRRAGEGSDAIAVVQVDSKVPEAALAELRKIEAVKVAKTVRL